MRGCWCLMWRWRAGGRLARGVCGVMMGMGMGGWWDGEEEVVVVGVVSSWYEDSTADEGVGHNHYCIIKIVFESNFIF